MDKVQIKMTSDEDIIQALNNLGLTTLQAKVYLVLVRREKERVQNISKAAKIDRSNTYQAVLQLQEMGLIEKILGTPNIYQAVPIKDAISILLKQKEAQYTESKKEAEKLVRSIDKKDIACAHKEPDLKIVKKGKERELKDIIQAHKEAQKSFDYIINKKTFFTNIVDLHKNHLKCLERGVKYRVVTEKIELNVKQTQLLQIFSAHNFQIRFTANIPSMELVIRDEKRAIIPISPPASIGEGPILILTNTGIIEMLQNHFEKIWKESQEYQPKKSR